MGRSMRIGVSLSCILGMLAFLALPAAATTMVRYSLKELALNADAIVVGKFKTVRSVWYEEKGKIYTYLTVDVSETLKGEGRTSLTIRQLGGTVGKLVMKVTGTPTLAPEEEAVLFLHKTQAGEHLIYGLSQGMFRVVADPGGGAKKVRAINSSVDLLDPQTKKIVAAGGEGGADELSLDGFLQRVRQYLGEGGK